MSTERQVVRYVSRRRKGVLDLNDPPVESMYQQGGPGLSLLADLGVQANVGQAHQISGSAHPVPIDVEELDDDVVIASPTAFEEARNRRIVIDVDADDVASRLGHNSVNKRRRRNPNPPSIDCELYVNLEGSSGSMRVAPPPPPPPPPQEPVFSCPVCMGPLVEEVTTKCGHIFCKECITAAIKAQHKCPTCRKKLNVKNLIRVYLPAAK